MADSPGRSLRYEPSLDGMRGVAIAAVVAYHACAASGLDWVRGGFIGVSVFFTLSGFLITSLLLGEHERTGTIDRGRFWVRRIRRLSPAAATVALAVVLSSGVHLLSARASDVTAALWGFTNWHVILGGQARLLQTVVGPLGPTWSLGVEEQLYLLLLVAVVVAMGSRRPRRALGLVAAGVTLGSVVLANTISDWHPRLEFGTDVRAAEVAVGVGMAVLLGGLRAPRWSPRAGDLAAGLVLAALVGCFLFADYDPPWLLRGGYTLVALVTALTLAGLLCHGRVESILSSPAMVGLGQISYSLYLVHWPLMSVLTRERTHLDGVAQAVTSAGAAVIVAWLLYSLVEQPLRRGRSISGRSTVLLHLGATSVITFLAWVIIA